MAGRGGIGKPPELRIVEGNRGKRPIRRPKVPKTPAAVEPPDWLSDVARERWRSLAPELAELGLLSSIDTDSFAAYCQACARYREAVEAVAAEGLTVDTLHGGVKANPAVAIQLQCAAQIRAFALEFGLTPAARMRMAEAGREDGEASVQDLLDEAERAKSAG